ncbi:MAG TPA: hypothetical protein VFQ85_16325 [Mycobacteriales bacterium]|nr:hypothetical protein [Mycobacteriales bacterium]
MSRRHARRAGAATAAAVALALAACGAPEKDYATRLCHKIFPHQKVGAAYLTTAKKVKDHPPAPDQRAARDEWKDVSDTAAAAWCWMEGKRTEFTGAATEGGTPIIFRTGTPGSLPRSPDGPS